MPDQEKEFLKKVKAYEKTVKYGAKLMSPEMMNKFNTYYNSINNIQTPELKSYMLMLKKVAESPNFSNLDSLKEQMIAVLASKAYYDQKNLNDKNEIYNADKCLHPFYRRGLELAAASPFLSVEERSRAQEVSEQMNELVMRNTLAIESLPDVENMISICKDDEEVYNDRVKAVRERLTIAKTMFLAHLGSMYIMQSDGRNSEYNGSISDAMAHGGRTSFLLPQGNNDVSNKFKDYFFNADDGSVNHGTAVTSRIAATHSMSSGKNAAGGGAYKETGSKSFSGNYQMNPAIGGYGKKFGDKPILNDGKNGQVFIQFQPSNEEKGGYLMIGFENEASGKTGRTGHKHSMFGTESKFSSFMASKGGVGASKNGRLVDLSMYKPSQINDLLKEFNKRYFDMQSSITSLTSEPEKFKEAIKPLNKINEMLCGKIMNKDSFLEMMDMLGMNKTICDEVKESFRKDEQGKCKGQFTEMDRKAQEKLAAQMKKLDVMKIEVPKDDAEYEAFQVSPGMQKLLNTLNKAKSQKLDWTRESDKMKRIKLQLEDLTAVSTAGKLTKEEAELAFKTLYQNCARYVYDPTKDQKNDRMTAVKAVFAYVDNELNKLNVGPDFKNAMIDQAKLENNVAMDKSENEKTVDKQKSIQ